MNSQLGDELLARMKKGEIIVVRHANATDLADFVARQWECHANVQRWCDLHPGHGRAMGWIISAQGILDRHSVVNTGPQGLLDITPLPDRESTLFLSYEGDPAQFDRLPNQIIIIDPDGVNIF